MRLNYLTISDLEKKKRGDIFVINTSSESEFKTNAEILIPVPQSHGKGDPDVVKVHQSWLPFNVTSEVTRERVLTSTHFRRAVSKGLIKIISEDDADRLLGSAGSGDERQRLKAQSDHVKAAGAPRTIADSKATVARADGSVDDDEDEANIVDVNMDNGTSNIVSAKTMAKEALAGVEEMEPGIDATFTMWVNKLQLMDDVTVCSEIRARRKFTTKQLAFLDRNLRGNGKKHLKAATLVSNAMQKKVQARQQA